MRSQKVLNAEPFLWVCPFLNCSGERGIIKVTAKLFQGMSSGFVFLYFALSDFSIILACSLSSCAVLKGKDKIFIILLF